jgi:hypothetical protein
VSTSSLARMARSVSKSFGGTPRTWGSGPRWPISRLVRSRLRRRHEQPLALPSPGFLRFWTARPDLRFNAGSGRTPASVKTTTWRDPNKHHLPDSAHTCSPYSTRRGPALPTGAGSPPVALWPPPIHSRPSRSSSLRAARAWSRVRSEESHPRRVPTAPRLRRRTDCGSRDATACCRLCRSRWGSRRRRADARWCRIVLPGPNRADSDLRQPRSAGLAASSVGCRHVGSRPRQHANEIRRVRSCGKVQRRVPRVDVMPAPVADEFAHCPRLQRRIRSRRAALDPLLCEFRALGEQSFDGLRVVQGDRDDHARHPRVFGRHAGRVQAETGGRRAAHGAACSS